MVINVFQGIPLSLAFGLIVLQVNRLNGTYKDVTKDMQTVNIGWGRVRLRRNIESSADYQVKLFGDAYEILAN